MLNIIEVGTQDLERTIFILRIDIDQLRMFDYLYHCIKIF